MKKKGCLWFLYSAGFYGMNICPESNWEPAWKKPYPEDSAAEHQMDFEYGEDNWDEAKNKIQKENIGKLFSWADRIKS